MGELQTRIIDDCTIKSRVYCYAARQPCPIYPDTICGLRSNVRESQLWCPECGSCGEWVALFRVFTGINVATVWHEAPNLATGRLISDPKQFRRVLKETSERDSERLGMKVDYQPVDMTDKDALGVTDEGLDATHDRAVSEGRKESRGRFVF